MTKRLGYLKSIATFVEPNYANASEGYRLMLNVIGLFLYPHINTTVVLFPNFLAFGRNRVVWRREMHSRFFVQEIAKLHVL